MPVSNRKPEDLKGEVSTKRPLGETGTTFPSKVHIYMFLYTCFIYLFRSNEWGATSHAYVRTTFMTVIESLQLNLLQFITISL